MSPKIPEFDTIDQLSENISQPTFLKQLSNIANILVLQQ